MFLELRYLRVVDAEEAINMDCVLLQASRELLVGPSADTENWKLLSNFLVVSGILIWVEVVLVFLDRCLLIES